MSDIITKKVILYPKGVVVIIYKKKVYHVKTIRIARVQ